MERTKTNKGVDRQRMMSTDEMLTEIVEALKEFKW